VDAVTLLARHGVEVHYPKTQSCCGMPVFSRGDLVAAKRLAERNIEAFRDYDIIVTACATCSSALKHLPEYLGLAETEGPTIRSFAARVVDLNEYLIHLFASAATALEVSKEYAGKKVTWHDPCHLSRHQGIVEQPRRILRAVSNVRYVEMPEADRCCGMGGAFGIHHYELSEKIAKRKVECIRESGADLVVTSCPGCLIQLDHALVQNGLPQRAVHIAHFLKGKAPPHRHLGAART
jgi:glycolate oxidase iron-sulfur subunit